MSDIFETEGFLVTLPVEEQDVIRKVREFLIETNQNRGIYDDWTLWRFCKAQNFVREDSIEAIQNNIKFYNDFNPWHYMSNDYTEIECIIQTFMKNYCTIDAEGRPTYFYKKGDKEFSWDLVNHFSDKFIYEHAFAQIEFIQRGIYPYCSYLSKRRINKFSMVFDCTGFGISTFQKLLSNAATKSRNEDIKSIKKANYPGFNGANFYVINAPWWFNGIWKFAKLLINTENRTINIYGSDYQEDLKKAIGVQNQPKDYGGDYEVDWDNYVPNGGPWYGYCDYQREKHTFFLNGEEFSDPMYGAQNFEFTDEQLKDFEKRYYDKKYPNLEKIPNANEIEQLENESSEDLIQESKRNSSPNLFKKVKEAQIVQYMTDIKPIPLKHEDNGFEEPTLKIHSEEVKFVVVNNKNKLKSEIIVENYGDHNIILKAKSNMSNRYAVRPIACMIKSRSSVSIEILALMKDLGNISEINDKFLFTYADVRSLTFNNENLQEIFKSKDMKFYHAKIVINFYTESNELLSMIRTSSRRGSIGKTEKINSNITPYKSVRSRRQSKTIYEDVKDQKKSLFSNGNSGNPLDNINPQIKKLKQELDNNNARIKYQQNQANNQTNNKKRSGYQLWQLILAVVIGAYLGSLFSGMTKL